MVQITNHPLYRKHNLDSAMSSLWEFYRSRFLQLFIISFVMSAATQYGSSLMNFSDITNTTDPMVLLEKLKGYILPLVILALVSLFFSNILHYYILHKPLDVGKNIFISTLESLKYFIPYIIILILLAFAGSFFIALGLMVFIVGVFFPLVYLMMISFFILPLMMSEGINIGNTITRTIKFAHRNFWNNMGWTAVFLILLVIVSVVLSSLVMIPFTGSFLKSIFNPENSTKLLDIASNPVYIFLSAIVNALTLPLIPIFGFIIYFNGHAGEEVVHAPSYGDADYKVTVEDLYARPSITKSGEEKEKSENQE
jgi:hypothetical protein